MVRQPPHQVYEYRRMQAEQVQSIVACLTQAYDPEIYERTENILRKDIASTEKDPHSNWTCGLLDYD